MNGVSSYCCIGFQKIENRPRIYFAFLLIISGAVNGAFLFKISSFFLFYELELIPCYHCYLGWLKSSLCLNEILDHYSSFWSVDTAAFLGIALVTGNVNFGICPIRPEKWASHHN